MEDVDVCGKAVIEVVLNLATQASEFGHEPSEYAQFVHFAKGRAYVTDFLKDRAKGYIGRS